MTGSAPQDRVAPLQKQFFANYHNFGKWGTRLCIAGQQFAATLPGVRRLMEDVLGVDHRRELPAFPEKTWEQLFREEPALPRPRRSNPPNRRCWRTCSPTTVRPSAGWRRSALLRAIGADVVLTPSMPDGRAAMSQGMIETARQQARAMAAMLRRYLDSGRKIVVR